MAWNPSPRVADCRDIARKWKKDQVIIIGIDDVNMEMATYGETKALCASADIFGKVAWDAIMKRAEQPEFEELPMG